MTLFVTLSSVALAAAAGVPLGVWLGLARFRGKRAVVALVYTGMGLPPVVVGLSAYLLLSRSGPLAPLGWLFTPAGMIVAQAVIALPIITGLTMASVASVPAEFVLQVRSLGASAGQARRAVLREAWPGVIAALAAGLGRGLAEVGAAQMVGGNIEGHTRVLTTAILLETSKGEFALALTLGGWLLGLCLLLNVLVLRLQGRPLT